MIFFTFLETLLISTLLIPITIKVCNKYSLYDEVNARKIHSGNIPRLGGIAIFLSFAIGYCTYLMATPNLSARSKLPLLIAAMLIFVFGIHDDLITMRAIHKLIVQSVATAIVIFAGFRFQYIFSIPLHSTFIARSFSFTVTLFWVLGLINAYNLIDGMDGLCGTLSLSVFLTMAAIYSKFNSECVVICLIISASIIGFLFFNKPNAKIFMGDNGSQVLGFLVAVLPLSISADPKLDFEFNRFLILLNLTAIPVMDTIAAIWRRIRDHKSIFSPDRSHLHHKLLNIGFNKVSALILIVCVQLFICGTVILSVHVTKHLATIALAFTFITTSILFAIIHYANRKIINNQETMNQR